MVKKVEEVADSTAWMLDNDVANFVLLHQKEVLYMCMVSGILGREETTFALILSNLSQFLIYSTLLPFHILSHLYIISIQLGYTFLHGE